MRVSAALLSELLANRPIFRTKDVACRYGVSTRTIQRWRCQGILPKPRILHGPFWTPADIARFEANKGQPT